MLTCSFSLASRLVSSRFVCNRHHCAEIHFAAVFCFLELQIFTRTQVVLSGGRLQPGTTKPEEGIDRHQWSIMNSPATRDDILPHVLFIQKILRRRPFMIKSLENVMRRWLQSLVCCNLVATHHPISS